ncbi:hypothetical protein DICA4_C03356 [Diutina catenulata]
MVIYKETTLSDLSAKFPDAPCRFLFKNEYEQPPGSFKYRGISHLIEQSLEAASAEGKQLRVYSSSGGNAGMAAAYAAKEFGVACTVVLPQTSKEFVKKHLEELNAEVVVHGAHWGEADKHTRELQHQADAQGREKAIYVHPFDDPVVWEGHGSMVDELAKQVPLADHDKIRGIVCSCGGGGLFNGVVEGLKRNPSLDQVKVFVTETKQAPCFSEAIKAGHSVQTPVNTIVTSLGSPYVSQRSLEIFDNQEYPVHLEVIDDLDAVKGAVDYYDLTGTSVEPSCGATLSFAFGHISELLRQFENLGEEDIIVFIVCGGTGVTKELMEHYREITKE